jgi:hypothetical protein
MQRCAGIIRSLRVPIDRARRRAPAILQQYKRILSPLTLQLNECSFSWLKIA